VARVHDAGDHSGTPRALSNDVREDGLPAEEYIPLSTEHGGRDHGRDRHSPGQGIGPPITQERKPSRLSKGSG